MTFAHRSSCLFYFIASPESERKERQNVGMYANTVQKTQKSYFLMFQNKVMAKEPYRIKQMFESEKRTLFTSFYRMKDQD